MVTLSIVTLGLSTVVSPSVTSFATVSSVQSLSNQSQNHNATSPEVHITSIKDQVITGEVYNENVKHTFSLTMNGTITTLIIDGNAIFQFDKTGAWLGSTSSITKSLANGKVNFTHAGHSYYYVSAAKMTSAQMSKYSGIASTILSAVGGIVSSGFSLGLAAAEVIRSTKSSSHNYWYTVKIYCTKNYKYYAFKTYAYKNAKRTSLAYTTTKYKTMF